MKRSVIAISVLTFVLFAAACATAPAAAPSVIGVIDQIDGAKLTIKAADGQMSTVNIVPATRVYWPNSTAATKSVLMTGHPVHVWFTEGTQNASKILISN